MHLNRLHSLWLIIPLLGCMLYYSVFMYGIKRSRDITGLCRSMQVSLKPDIHKLEEEEERFYKILPANTANH